jgi:hypothetical protein
MAKYVIQSKRGAPPGGAYSQGWRAGDFVFVSGTGPIDPVPENWSATALSSRRTGLSITSPPFSRLTALPFAMWSRSILTSATRVSSRATTQFMPPFFAAISRAHDRRERSRSHSRHANRNRLRGLQREKNAIETGAHVKEQGRPGKRIKSKANYNGEQSVRTPGA